MSCISPFILCKEVRDGAAITSSWSRIVRRGEVKKWQPTMPALAASDDDYVL